MPPSSLGASSASTPTSGGCGILMGLRARPSRPPLGLGSGPQAAGYPEAPGVEQEEASWAQNPLHRKHPPVSGAHHCACGQLHPLCLPQQKEATPTLDAITSPKPAVPAPLLCTLSIVGLGTPWGQGGSVPGRGVDSKAWVPGSEDAARATGDRGRRASSGLSSQWDSSPRPGGHEESPPRRAHEQPSCGTRFAHITHLLFRSHQTRVLGTQTQHRKGTEVRSTASVSVTKQEPGSSKAASPRKHHLRRCLPG